MTHRADRAHPFGYANEPIGAHQFVDQRRLFRELRQLIDDDPILRLHSTVWTSGSPDPPHPSGPGDHRMLPLDQTSLGAGRPSAPRWRRALAGGGTLALPPADCLTEYVIRPLVKVFRRLLELRGWSLSCETGLVLELTADGRPTGRIGFTERTAVHACASPGTAADRAVVAGHARTLSATLLALAGLPDPPESAGPESGDENPTASTRDAVWLTVAQEFRHLSTEAANLLREPHPLRGCLHTVPTDQDQILRRVLADVQSLGYAHRTDQNLPRPAVAIDLDLCALTPLERTTRAVREIASGCPGAPDGIPALADPGALSVLPAYSQLAWGNFLAVNDLRRSYPTVDWDQVRTAFLAAFFRPWDLLRSDQPTPGLIRFVRDVENLGGVVVFNSARRNRVRCYTEDSLAAHDLRHVRLLTTPDERTEPVEVTKTRNLQRLAGLRIVAIFDDLTENRRSLAKAFPDATVVAVSLPGFTNEWTLETAPDDDPPVVSTFETLPRPVVDRGAAGPALSRTSSLAGILVGEMGHQPLTEDHAVRLDPSRSRDLIRQLVADADIAADRTAKTVRELSQSAPAGQHPATAMLHRILTRKQFWRGVRSAYPQSRAEYDMLPFIEADEPVRAVVVGFPIKQGQSGLKARGELPDLAELGFLVRLRELCRAARGVYGPGLAITVLTDGSHFRPRPARKVQSYLDKLSEYLELVGVADQVELVDIDQAAEHHLGVGVRDERARVLAHYKDTLRTAFDGLDVTCDPSRTLTRTEALDVSRSWPSTSGGSESELNFVAMFRSLLHAVPVPPPREGVRQATWSRAIYSDVFGINDPAADPQVREARAQVLARTWEDTIHYLAANQADRDLGYSKMFGRHVRLTVSLPVPGRCGFTPLGGSALIPWHGTGAIDGRGHVSTEFLVVLRDRGFVPVYSPFLGDEQPWFMVPVTATRPRRDGPGSELDPQFAATIRMRRG